MNTLTASGAVNLNGGASVQNGLTVRGGTTTDSLTVSNSAKVGGDLSVGGSARVAGQVFLNGGATISNNLTVNSGANVDMGGNVVHDVGTPIVGTDAANKAYVNSGMRSLGNRIDKVSEGVAIAMAVQNPTLTGGDRFGITFNWGAFDSNNAFGMAAIGIIGQNMFGAGEKMGLTGGFGFTDRQVAGRAGVQFTW